MRAEYMLEEYQGLMDAWKVYQGVALYREYRGRGGAASQLDDEPRPCTFCLLKIVDMAKATRHLSTVTRRA